MLAIIPARGGSKGLPGKNIRLLGGLPLVAHTIRVAQEASCIKRIVLSTDDESIARIGKDFGAEVPFLRPKELAQDHSKSIDNYTYTLDRINQNRTKPYEDFVVLQPTSPLRIAHDIQQSVGLFFEKNAESVISVSEASHPASWYRTIDDSGVLRSYFPDNTSNLNRQELKPSYLPNGAVFVLSLNLLKSKYSFYSEKTYPYIMPQSRAIDVDTLLDFKFAEYIMKNNLILID
jgi:CMP-N,N'-diacetyllegionaminic acid synthase